MQYGPELEFVSGGAPSLTVILVHGRTLTPDYMRALAHSQDFQ